MHGTTPKLFIYVFFKTIYFLLETNGKIINSQVYLAMVTRKQTQSEGQGVGPGVLYCLL